MTIGDEAQNIELGGKFTLADGALELNATVFSEDFQDLQISIFDGVLGFTEVEPGALITKADVIATLDDLAFLDADFSVPERFFGEVEPGDAGERSRVPGYGRQHACAHVPVFLERLARQEVL